jgi:nucleoside diphosphate kinase
MALERTFSMIKPDATRRNLTGAITKALEEAGLRVVASRRVWMSRREAEGFYAVHKERPFFGELVDSMTAGPTIVQVLEGENAFDRRKLRAWLGCARDRCPGDQILVLRHRDRWLISASSKKAGACPGFF